MTTLLQTLCVASIFAASTGAAARHGPLLVEPIDLGQTQPQNDAGQTDVDAGQTDAGQDDVDAGQNDGATDTYAERGTITTAYAEPVNGGINPEYIGVRLTGTIQAGGNACEASRVVVKWATVEGEEGRAYETASLVPNPEAQNTMCPLYVDPSFKGLEFDHTVRTTLDAYTSTYLQNVGALGTAVLLSDLPAPSPGTCPAIAGPCTMELQPTTCVYDNDPELTFTGDNECQARQAANFGVCDVDDDFEEDLLVCTPDLL